MITVDNTVMAFLIWEGVIDDNSGQYSYGLSDLEGLMDDNSGQYSYGFSDLGGGNR